MIPPSPHPILFFPIDLFGERKRGGIKDGSRSSNLDPCTELIEMKRKQREQRKRSREKHPEIFQEQKIIFYDYLRLYVSK